MTEQIRRTKEAYHKDMLFLFVWNEWAEGGYMEPDENLGLVIWKLFVTHRSQTEKKLVDKTSNIGSFRGI